MPGVSTGGDGNAFDARINGGMQSGDEAVVDGVSMQQGFMSQSGMVSIFQDFPFSPDMVSEVKVLTSSYAPEYGVDNWRADHGRHEVGRQTASTARCSSITANDALNGDAVGRRQQAESQAEQLRRQHRRPDEGPGLWVELGQELLLLRLRGLPADGRLQSADAVDPFASRSATATSATGATRTAT